MKKKRTLKNKVTKTSKPKTKLEKLKSKGVKILNKKPSGWKKIKGATNAPVGYTWCNNGKSLFSGEYKQALVKKTEDKKR